MNQVDKIKVHALVEKLWKEMKDTNVVSFHLKIVFTNNKKPKVVMDWQMNG